MWVYQQRGHIIGRSHDMLLLQTVTPCNSPNVLGKFEKKWLQESYQGTFQFDGRFLFSAFVLLNMFQCSGKEPLQLISRCKGREAPSSTHPSTGPLMTLLTLLAGDIFFCKNNFLTYLVLHSVGWLQKKFAVILFFSKITEITQNKSIKVG